MTALELIDEVLKLHEKSNEYKYNGDMSIGYRRSYQLAQMLKVAMLALECGASCVTHKNVKDELDRIAMEGECDYNPH